LPQGVAEFDAHDFHYKGLGGRFPERQHRLTGFIEGGRHARRRRQRHRIMALQMAVQEYMPIMATSL
jgi:hypothetical protein